MTIVRTEKPYYIIRVQQASRSGYEKLIGEDIELSAALFEQVDKRPEFKSDCQNLSITTFRYIPLNTNENNLYLNTLNEELLNSLQAGGEVFLSNAIVNKNYCLRACIVNFRTSVNDIKEIIEIIIKEARKTHLKLINQKK